MIRELLERGLTRRVAVQHEEAAGASPLAYLDGVEHVLGSELVESVGEGMIAHEGGVARVRRCLIVVPVLVDSPEVK